MNGERAFRLGLDALTPGLLCEAIDSRPALVLTETVLDRLDRGYLIVRRATETGRPVYGLSTGVGSQIRYSVEQDAEEVDAFNRWLILDHVGGVGPDLSEPECYAVVLARLHALALGGSGIAPSILARAVELLNGGVVPAVPARGSVGASDLSACASLAAAYYLGEGNVYYAGSKQPADRILNGLGCGPVRLTGKDALSFVSANALSLGCGAIVAVLLECLLELHLDVVAMSFEAFGANVSALASRAHQLRPHTRQGSVAARVRERLQGSYLWREGAARNLQDPLSFRCVPQVAGALDERAQRLNYAIERELNSISDNPVVLIEQDEILSNGNFDTTNLYLEVDGAMQALVRVILMAERRIDKFLSAAFSGLPVGLSDHPTSQGYGILNHTASSLAAEAVTESAGGIPYIAPLSEGVEDVGAMTPLAIMRLRHMIGLMLTLCAIEALLAARAIQLRDPGPLACSSLLENVRSAIGNRRTPGGQTRAVEEALVRVLPPGAPAYLYPWRDGSGSPSDE